jgi:hypothetical protein
MTAVRQMQSLGGASKDASAPSSKPQGDSPSAGSSDEPKKPGERLKAMRERGGDPARMLARMAERFKELDKNGDGKLSAEELGDRKRMFEMLDTDKDGFVDQDELKAMGAKLRDRAANANQ